MILCYGDTTTIASAEWYVMELRSERTAEEILKRVLGSLKSVFRNEAVEIFVPEQRTRENSFTLMTDSYVFVHADDAAKVGKLRRVTGVQGLVSKDDSTRITSFLTVPSDYIETLQARVMDAYYRRGAAIREGCWVRILDGQDRDLYGHVITVSEGRACVRVDLKTKLWFVDTSIYNLLDCSDIEPRFRVFYYCKSIEKMIEDDPDGAAEILKDDLFHDEAAVRSWLYGEDANAPVHAAPEDAAKTSRERTPSRFVRSLIQSGEKNIRKLLLQTIDAIRLGHLRCPKTTTILWHIIRTEMLHHAFPGENLGTYTDLVNKHGNAYALVPGDVQAAFPELALKEEQERTEVQVPLNAQGRSTVTSYVRAHLKGGRRDLMAVVKQVLGGLQKGTVRAPKHLDSFVQAIRTQVFRHFRQFHPLSSYAEIMEQEGKGLAITPSMLRERFPELEAIILGTRAQQVAQIPSVKTIVPFPEALIITDAPIPVKRTRVPVPAPL